MGFGLRSGKVSVVVWVSTLLSACMSLPVMPPDVPLPPSITQGDGLSLMERRGLRLSTTFETGSLITAPAITPEEVAPENEEEVYRKAKLAADAENAPESVPLDLQAVRGLALQNNLDLQVFVHDPSIAQAGYERELAKFEKVFSLGTTYAGSTTSTSADIDTVSVTPKITVPTRSGSSLELSLPFSHTDSEVVGSGESFGSGIDVSASVPLMRNAGVSFNTASISQAGLALRQADARTKLEAIRVLANAEKAYWSYYAAFEDLKIQLRQYELSLEQLRIAQRLVDEGARTKVEVTRAESGASRQFDSVIQAETTRRLAERALKRVVNDPTLPLDHATVVVPQSLPTPLGLSFNRPGVVDLALNNRMELLVNEIQSVIDSITVGINRNQVLPDVRFDFSYSFSGSKSTFSRAVGQLADKELNSYSVGLTADIPLSGNQAARATLRESILRKSRTDASRRVLEIAIRQETLDAIDVVEQSWQSILSNQTTVQRAALTYEEEKQQFQLGDVTSTEVLTALSELAVAQSAEIQSLRSYQNSLVDLAFASGTVLGLGGVVWSPVAGQFGEQATYKPSWWNPQS